MCYAASCNPTCGKCRPKRIIQLDCPACGKMAEMTREEYLLLFDLPHRRTVMDRKILERGGPKPPVCPVCGLDLTEAFRAEVQPLPCTKSQIICGFPCGGRTEPHREGVIQCRQMVPVGKLPGAAASDAGASGGAVQAGPPDAPAGPSAS